MRILGLDPGGQFTGFGVIDWVESQASHVAHGVFDFSKCATLPEKLQQFYLQLGECFDTYQPATVSVEQIFLGKNADSAFKLGHIRAVALLMAAQRQCSLGEYAPRSVKKTVTGDGGAEKEHVRRVVFQTLGIVSDARHDASDALALAICHGSKLSLAALADRLKEFEL